MEKARIAKALAKQVAKAQRTGQHIKAGGGFQHRYTSDGRRVSDLDLSDSEKESSGGESEPEETAEGLDENGRDLYLIRRTENGAALRSRLIPPLPFPISSKRLHPERVAMRKEIRAAVRARSVWVDVRDDRMPAEEYIGEWVDGHRQGLGYLKYCDGSVYMGRFESGMPHGVGSLEFPNGDKYRGDFLAGQIYGDGRMQYGDGFEYSGSFQRGWPHGRGILTCPDGTKFDGTWVFGVKHGRITIRYADGSRREGEWSCTC